MDGQNNALILPFPPTINHYWLARGKMRFLSARAKHFRMQVLELCQLFSLAHNLKHPLIGRLQVEINVFPPDRRLRDLDNLAKGTLDSLTHAGVYLDDSQIDRLIINRREIDRPSGHIEIIVTEMNQE